MNLMPLRYGWLKRLPVLLGFVALFLVIPLTVFLTLQRQEIRKKAAEETGLSLEAPAEVKVGESFKIDIRLNTGDPSIPTTGTDIILKYTFVPALASNECPWCTSDLEKSSFLSEQEVQTQITQVNIANPASVYCEELGGKLEMRTSSDGGQYGMCFFSDGTECEEWALYRGECQPPVSSLSIVQGIIPGNLYDSYPTQEIGSPIMSASESYPLQTRMEGVIKISGSASNLANYFVGEGVFASLQCLTNTPGKVTFEFVWNGEGATDDTNVVGLVDGKPQELLASQPAGRELLVVFPTPTPNLTPLPSPTGWPGDCGRPCSGDSPCPAGLKCGTPCPPGAFCAQILTCYNPDCPFRADKSCVCLEPTATTIPAPSCVEHGQMTSNPEDCCSGLKPIPVTRPDPDTNVCMAVSTKAVICANCGNGFCESWENVCNCANDCYKQEPTPILTLTPTPTPAAPAQLNFDLVLPAVRTGFTTEATVYGVEVGGQGVLQTLGSTRTNLAGAGTIDLSEEHLGKTYQLFVRTPNHLRKRTDLNVSIQAGNNYVDFGTLIPGDVYLVAGAKEQDNLINNFDVAEVFSQWSLEPPLSLIALKKGDFNLDGLVNSWDLKVVFDNFGQRGDIPNEATSSSEGQFCGGYAGILCPSGYKCVLEGSYPDAGGTCVPMDVPVSRPTPVL